MKDNIIDIDVSDAMRDKYREYATAVVVSRALPDVRDGLKPVHRRILYGMFDGGYDWTKGHSKSARIVGDVMGRYHPHGDSSIYEAMTRLTQPWSLMVPLIDGQGNFGSPDGDGPAAMRYTEARLSQAARYMVDGLNENTVDFAPNYDGRDQEPVVLPAAFPNILVNGGSGIAVGMASSLPTHNFSEVIDVTLARMRDPRCALDDLLALMPAPDFPTGGRIMGVEGVRKGYETGRGTLTIEATVTPDKDGRTPILVYTDMPWGVSKTDVLARIKALMESGAAPDITSARDESGRAGVRFVVEMKQGADPERVDAFLKSQTELRTTISMNLTMLDQYGVPREMGLIDILDAWIDFRRQTLRRRLNNELAKLRDAGRLLLGRMAALSVIDKIIKLIREASDRAEAREGLMSMSYATSDFSDFISTLGTPHQRKAKRFSLSSEQADHILEMRLQRLTGLERAALAEEGNKLIARMREIRDHLAHPERLDSIIINELETMKRAHGVARMTEIEDAVSTTRIKMAPPPIKLEKVRVLVDAKGALLRAGKNGDHAYVQEISTDTHSRIIAFMRDGRSFALAINDLPSVENKEGFRSLTGILGTRIEGEVASYVPLNPETDVKATLCFVSRDGAIRRTSATEFFRIPQGGKAAMNIEPSDAQLLTVFKETDTGGGVFMGSADGRFIRFALDDIRVMAGRGSRGIRGFSLQNDDEVVSAFEVPVSAFGPEECEEAEQSWLGKRKGEPVSGPQIVQIAKSGHAKRTIEAAYRQTNRANRGTNDKGPAKGIGKMLLWARITDDADTIRLADAHGDIIAVRAEKIKRGGKATTGSVLNPKED